MPLDLQIQSWELRNQILTIALRCKSRGVACPGCGMASSRIHGTYERQIHDLPCHGFRVRLQAEVRRFRCANPACDRQTFAEPLSLAMPYQRRSQRLQKVHAQVGLALGGLPSARLLRHLGMQVSGDTILRTLSRSMAGFEASRPHKSPHDRDSDSTTFTALSERLAVGTKVPNQSCARISCSVC